jgi:formylglycine-generating enzyme required for sulfatase activity
MQEKEYKMKRRAKMSGIFTVLAILGLALAACGGGSTPGSGPTADPADPVISAQLPDTATYDLNAETVQELTVTATAGDGGVLSYQWYRNTANSNEGGTAIEGATEASFTPPTDAKGVVYYYVIVTNTLNGKTANATSNTAGIGVDITIVKINSGLTVQSKVYDGTTTATVTGTAVLSGVENGDVVTVIVGTVSFNDKNVGTDKAITFTGWSLTGADAGNYMLSAQHEDITGEITAKVVTITGLTVEDKPYDGTTEATVSGTAVISGLISGDTVTATGGTAEFADKNIGTGKTVTFSGWSLTGTDADNYSLSEQPTTVKAGITAKSVTITGLTVANKEYDGTTTATVSGTAVVSGTIDGDTVTVSAGTIAFANKNVGTGKTITLSGWSLTGTDAGNYSLSAQSNATANITAKPVTITGLSASNKFHNGLPSATVSGTAVINGLVSGDTVTVVTGTAAFADANIGNGKTVTFSGWSLTGTDAGNYSLSAQPANVTANILEAIVIAMVQINAGTFTMGSPDTEANRGTDETQHQVTLIKGFYMGEFEVTQEQYQAVMGSNPSYWIYSLDIIGESGTPGKLPVEQVSWYDALVFCNKLSILEGLSPVYSISGSTDPSTWGTVPTSGNATWKDAVMDKSKNGYRLPTEAEWEYACRAGTTTVYNNTGNTISNDTGWYSVNSRTDSDPNTRKTHKVGLKTANAWGLYDMHGNVGEWCWDWYKEDITTDTSDPTGAVIGTYRVRRGGTSLDSAQGLRSAFRSGDSPDTRNRFYGFRLVRSLQ